MKTLQDKCLIHDTELQKAKEKQLSHDQAAKKAIAALEKEMALRVDQVWHTNASSLSYSTTLRLFHMYRYDTSISTSISHV